MHRTDRTHSLVTYSLTEVHWSEWILLFHFQFYLLTYSLLILSRRIHSVTTDRTQVVVPIPLTELSIVDWIFFTKDCWYKLNYQLQWMTAVTGHYIYLQNNLTQGRSEWQTVADKVLVPWAKEAICTCPSAINRWCRFFYHQSIPPPHHPQDDGINRDRHFRMSLWRLNTLLIRADQIAMWRRRLGLCCFRKLILTMAMCQLICLFSKPQNHVKPQNLKFPITFSW